MAKFHELVARIHTPMLAETQMYDGVKLIDKRSLASRTTTVNNYLSKLSTYHDRIPLDDIFAKLRENGMEPVQEDGTPWEGFLLGRDGRAHIELRTGGANRYLSLSYHKMDVSGRYEVTAYVS